MSGIAIRQSTPMERWRWPNNDYSPTVTRLLVVSDGTREIEVAEWEGGDIILYEPSGHGLLKTRAGLLSAQLEAIRILEEDHGKL